MPKFRFIATIIFGTIALHYHHEAHAQQQPETHPNEQPIMPPAYPLVDIGVSATRNDAGCKKDEENRNSDLCAQWKSADAAERSAEASERAVIIDAIGTVVGVLTFIAAALAAVYARSAANHTRAGAEAANAAIQQAKEAAALEYRAWLVFHTPVVTRVNAGDGGFDDGDRFLWINYKLTIENVGRSPAREISVYNKLVGGTKSHLMQAALNEFRAVENHPDGFSLAPNEKRELRLSGTVDFNTPPEGTNTVAIHAVLGVKYIAIAGGEPVSSYSTYFINHEPAAGLETSTMYAIDASDVDKGEAKLSFVATGGKMD